VNQLWLAIPYRLDLATGWDRPRPWAQLGSVRFVKLYGSCRFWLDTGNRNYSGALSSLPTIDSHSRWKSP